MLSVLTEIPGIDGPDAGERYSRRCHTASPKSLPRPYTPLMATAEATMRKLNSFKAKARALARLAMSTDCRHLNLSPSFEEGFDDAREWLDQPSTKEELERLCVSSRAKHKAA